MIDVLLLGAGAILISLIIIEVVVKFLIIVTSIRIKIRRDQPTTEPIAIGLKIENFKDEFFVYYASDQQFALQTRSLEDIVRFMKEIHDRSGHSIAVCDTDDTIITKLAELVTLARKNTSE